MNKSLKIIIGYSIFACIALYITENIFHPSYIVQMVQKILSFIVIPLMIGYYLKHSFGKLGKITKNSFVYGIGFGLLGAFIVGITYYLLRDMIDWGAIKESISSRGVTSTTFIFIFIYIMLGNSLLEEYFFRGIIFHSLYEYSSKLAYFTSSILFALYHITIFGTWFSGYLILLALFGLFIGAMFFAWLYKKTDGVWSAWIFHIIADLVILVIGYIELFS